MDNLYPTYVRTSSDHEKETANRKLRRLKFLLIVWLLTFLATLIWFTVAP